MTESAKQLADMVIACAGACMDGADTVTLSVRGPRPKKFPRGELLSVGTDGSRNYAVDPVRALAWLRDTAKSLR